MAVRSPVRRPIRYPADGLQGMVDQGIVAAPALSLDFTRREGLSGLAVTRSGNAYVTDATGARSLVAANQPRFDHDPRSLACLGLLYEPARTNLALYSDDISNANYFKDNATVTGTAVLVENAAASVHAVVQAFTLAGNTVYAASAELKQSGRRYAQLIADPGDATSYKWAMFDLQTGVISDSGGAGIVASIRSAPGGAWLCGLTFTSTAVPLSPYISINASNAATGFYPIYLGNSAAAIEIRGVQMEAGHCPTSRILTTSASAARSADAIALTGTAFSGIWNAIEGAALVEASMVAAPPASATTFLAAFNDGTASERINLYVNEANTGMALFIADGGVQQTLVSVASAANYTGATMRMAAAWALNNARLAAGPAGTLTALDTGVTMPTATQMQVGAQAGAGASGMATPIHFRRIAYWRQRVPDQALSELARAA